MGMRMTVYALGEADHARVLAEPTLVESLLGCEPGSRAAAALPRRACGLDKAWEAIHFVLAGSIGTVDGPLGFLLGGTDVGDIDIGYGPARAWLASEVHRISAALQPIALSVFAARLDVSRLLAESVYGVGEDEEENRAYLLAHYGPLHTFVLEADRRREGLIIALR